MVQEAGQGDLAQRYSNYVSLMAATAVMMFHDGQGKVRGVTRIKNAKAAPTPSNYELQTPCGEPVHFMLCTVYFFSRFLRVV